MHFNAILLHLKIASQEGKYESTAYGSNRVVVSVVLLAEAKCTSKNRNSWGLIYNAKSSINPKELSKTLLHEVQLKLIIISIYKLKYINIFRAEPLIFGLSNNHLIVILNTIFTANVIFYPKFIGKKLNLTGTEISKLRYDDLLKLLGSGSRPLLEHFKSETLLCQN